MFLKGYVKIDKRNIKKIKHKKDGATILYTKNLLPNGKNEFWIIDNKEKITSDGNYLIIKLSEVGKCEK